MKRIVRGNDFTMRIPVVKIVEGEKVAFPLPGCTDIVVRLCSAYRRLELAHTIDAKEDNVIVARVEGDRIPLGTYALEVRGKIFGNDWRSNEYEQVAIVDRNADADTELGETDEGENSVEMDTAVVVLPPDRELEALVKEAQAQNKVMSELSDTIKASEEGRVKSEELRAKSEEARVQAELTRASTEAERVQAEQVRESAENARADAENARVEAEAVRVTAESARVDAENTRVTAEQGRVETENVRVTAEGARADAENARVTAENARVTAEDARADAENARATAESERVTAENARTEAEEARQEAEKTRASSEAERVQAEQVRENSEGQRLAAEQGRVIAENARVTAENARVTAEGERVTAEGERVTAEGERVTAEGEREQGFTEKAAHLEELLQYIKDNHLEVDVKLVEAIKNTIKGTDEFVYLDANDGNVKSMPNTEQLGPNAAAVYYAGKRSIMPGEGNCMVIGYRRNILIRSLDLSGWDFEAATDMTYFLYYASGLKTLTLPENMMLANVTNMLRCFYDCRLLMSLDTSKWTLGNVTNMESCFNGCANLMSLDTSKWTLGNVTNMESCFNGCANLLTLDTSKWTLANVTNMSRCLGKCEKLQSLDTSKWTLANVTNMFECFFACSSLLTLDTSKWTLGNVTNMRLCFRDCASLREIDLSSCNITKCNDWGGCFTGLNRLKTLRIGLIDFSPCDSIDLFEWGTNPRELTGTLRGIRNDFRAVSSRMTRDSCMVVINGLEMVTEAKTLTLGVNNKPVSLGGKGSDSISDDDLKIATDKGWTVQFE
jgi:surface protein